LHLRGGVKGIIVKGSLVFSYSRIWVLSCTIYIPIGAGQYNLTFQPPFIRNIDMSLGY